jgi:hypothetical protein
VEFATLFAPLVLLALMFALDRVERPSMSLAAESPNGPAFSSAEQRHQFGIQVQVIHLVRRLDHVIGREHEGRDGLSGDLY